MGGCKSAETVATDKTVRRACRGIQQVLLVVAAATCSVAAVLLSLNKLSLTLCPSHNHLIIISAASSSHGNATSYDVDVPFKNADSTLEKSRDGGCDYTLGRWIKGAKVPLYSGNTCKRWLSGMWACRRMPGRPNFDFESYKWQPDGCELPTFTSQDFLARMPNKVVAIVGDSIGRQQYQSLMCMLTGGDDGALVLDVSKSYGLVKPRGAVRADGTAQRFTKTNTTIIYYWSASLCELEPLNKSIPDTQYAMHLDRPTAFVRKYLNAMDVLVLNTGHHWNRGKMAANKWVMHVNGKPNINNSLNRDIGAARNFTLHKVAAWLHNQREKNATRARIFVRSLSPRHFHGGDWDSGGTCDNGLIPVEKKIVTGGTARDPVVESAISGTSIHLLNVTYISQFRDEAHISKFRPNQNGQDCLHWCLPGVPDVWNELLYAKLLSLDEADNKGGCNTLY